MDHEKYDGFEDDDDYYPEVDDRYSSDDNGNVWDSDCYTVR